MATITGARVERESPPTDWKESIAPDESERFQRIAEAISGLQRRQAEGDHALRTLHAKPHVGARARFTVLPDLPDYARIGPFAAPRTYEALVRFSNGSGRPGDDHRPDVRGLAIKLLGVEGRKLIPGLEDARTQDFLMILTPSLPFRNSDEFMFFLLGAEHPLGFLPRAILRFGLLRTLLILVRFARGTTRRISSLATQTFHSGAPIQLGPYAIRYSVKPLAPPEPDALIGDSRNYLSDDLVRRLAAGPLQFDFRIQFYRDAQSTPIEDATVEWKEETSPFLTVARLEIPQQDLESPDGRRLREWVERLSFDPWHALVELRPLGDVMRARNHAYRASTMGRAVVDERTLSADSIAAAD
jgi:hypothetical protein